MDLHGASDDQHHFAILLVDIVAQSGYLQAFGVQQKGRVAFDLVFEPVEIAMRGKEADSTTFRVVEVHFEAGELVLFAMHDSLFPTDRPGGRLLGLRDGFFIL